MVSAENDLSLSRVASANHLQYEAQVEVGAFATSIIPTGAGSVLRSADVLSTTIGSWYNNSQWTFLFQFIPNVVSTGQQSFFRSASKLPVYMNAGKPGMYDGSETVGITGSSMINGAINKVSTAFSGTTGSVAINNGTVITGNQPIGYNISGTAYIGSNGDGFFSNSWIQKIQYWPRRLPNSQLQLLTA